MIVSAGQKGYYCALILNAKDFNNFEENTCRIKKSMNSVSTTVP